MVQKISPIALVSAFFCLLIDLNGLPLYAQTSVAGGGAVLKIQAGAYTVSGYDIQPIEGGVRIGIAEILLPRPLGGETLRLKGMTAEVRTGKTGYSAARDGNWSGRMPIALPGVALPVELTRVRVGKAGLAIDVSVRLPDTLGAGEARFTDLTVRPDGSFDPARTTSPIPARIGDIPAECPSARLEEKGLVLENFVFDTGFPILEGAVALKEVLVGQQGVIEHRSDDSYATFRYGEWNVKVAGFRPDGSALRCSAVVPSAIYPEGQGFPLSEAVFSGNGTFSAEVVDWKKGADPGVILAAGQLLLVASGRLTEYGLVIDEAMIQPPSMAGNGELFLKDIIVDPDWRILESPFTTQEAPFRAIGENSLYINIDALALRDDYLAATGSIELYEKLSPKEPIVCDADNPMLLDSHWTVFAEGSSVGIVIGGFPATLNDWALGPTGLDGDLSIDVHGEPDLYFAFSGARFYSDGTFRERPRLEDWGAYGTLGGFTVTPYEVSLSENGLRMSIYLDEMFFSSIAFGEGGGYRSTAHVPSVAASRGPFKVELSNLSFSTEDGVSAANGSVEISLNPSTILIRGFDITCSRTDDALIMESERFAPFVFGGGTVAPSRIELDGNGFRFSGELIVPSGLPEGLAGTALPLEEFSYSFADGRTELRLGPLDPAIAIVDGEGKAIAHERIGLSLIDGEIRLSIRD